MMAQPDKTLFNIVSSAKSAVNLFSNPDIVQMAKPVIPAVTEREQTINKNGLDDTFNNSNAGMAEALSTSFYLSSLESRHLYVRID